MIVKIWHSLYHHSDDVNESIIHDSIKRLSRPSASRKVVRDEIVFITNKLIENHLTPLPQEVTLMPILRGGLPMWEAANEFFSSPKSIFVNANKTKGTKIVQFDIMSNDKINGKLLIMDTVVATGDTICGILDKLKKLENGLEVYFMSCYCSPKGLERLRSHSKFLKVVSIGVLSESVDDNGFLIPATNGDVGDKLYS